MTQLFDQLVYLYRLITPDHQRQADVVISDEARLALVHDLVQKDPDDSGLLILSGDPDRLAIGQTWTFIIYPPKPRDGYLLENIQALVIAGQCREPERYYLRNPARAKNDPDVPYEIICYRTMLKFIALLKDASAHHDQSNKELIFIHSGYFSLIIRYSFDSMIKAASGAHALCLLFANPLNRQKKLNRLAQAVQDITCHVEPRERFTHLLDHVEHLVSEVRKSDLRICTEFCLM